MLPNGIRFHINDALYSNKSRRNLLSFRYICRNVYHIETMNEDNIIIFTLLPLYLARSL